MLNLSDAVTVIFRVTLTSRSQNERVAVSPRSEIRKGLSKLVIHGPVLQPGEEIMFPNPLPRRFVPLSTFPPVPVLRADLPSTTEPFLKAALRFSKGNPATSLRWGEVRKEHIKH